MHIPLVFLARLDSGRMGNMLSRLSDEDLREYNTRRIVRGVTYDPVMPTLEDYLTEDNWYSVEIAVSEDGTLFRCGDRHGMMTKHFEELAALAPERRWSHTLSMVRGWAAHDIARLVGSDSEAVFTDQRNAEAALRDFLRDQSRHGDTYRLRLAADILFVLENCSVYPFSEAPELFAEWPYLVDFSYTDDDRSDSKPLMVFVDMHL